MKKITAWSYSRWSDYDKCPQLAKFKYVDRLPEPENPAMKRGGEVHDALAAFLAGSADAPQAAERFTDLLAQLRDLEPLYEQQWGFTCEWRVTGWFDRDTWFRSVLDVCVVYEDNTADVVDFKTGKESPTHAQQGELYAASVFVRYSQVQRITVRFWYLDHGTESVYRFARADAAELIEKWTKRVQPMLNDTVFAPRPGKHCHWCNFAKSKEGPCKYG